MSTLALERCDLRLTADEKHLLQYAAQLSGVSLASFIRQVAVREAKKVIEREKVVYFTAQESKELLEALDRPFHLMTNCKRLCIWLSKLSITLNDSRAMRTQLRCKAPS